MAAPAFAVKLLDPNVLSNKTYIMIIGVVIIVILTLGYISVQLNLKTTNCAKLSNKSNNTVTSISNSSINKNKPLNNYFIKTAYNCCCVGNFKNDYVDKCALKNCASYGVRALDFQIYSLKNKPIVSASFIESTQYKEIYNHLTFYETLLAVKQYFIDDSENINIVQDALCNIKCNVSCLSNCQKCGSKMIQKKDSLLNNTKNRSFYPTYDEETGEKIDYSGIKYTCPKYRWYNFHDNYFGKTKKLIKEDI